jgi:predicted nucleic acid-binding protein
MLVVDGSVWVSRFLPAEETHQESREWLERHIRAGGQLVEPLLLLVELSASISRHTGDAGLARETAERLTTLRSVRFVPLDRRLTALATRMAADMRLRAADAMYIAIAHQLGLPLLTWDRAQFERGGAIRIGTPREMAPLPSS